MSKYIRFPHCLRINSPNCGVFKFYFNLHIVHVTVKLFQNNIVRAAEIIPSIGIFFFELPEVWCRLTIADKGWSCGLWRVIWKCYFILRDLKLKNRNCDSYLWLHLNRCFSLRGNIKLSNRIGLDAGTITVIHHSSVELSVTLWPISCSVLYLLLFFS